MSASPPEAFAAGPANPPVLRAEGLVKRFPIRQPWPKPTGQLVAVRDVSLSLNEGETLGIVGESGCGKSTLSRMLVGTLAPSSGRLLLDGVDVGALAEPQRRALLRDVQMVFQSPYTSLNPRMRIADIVREPLDIHERNLPKRERQARALDMLERVGLGEAYAGRYPHALSGGQQQRVGIARALARKPRIIVCDEPVSALDVSVQAQVINLLRVLQQTLKVSYVFVSHDLAVVANVSHTIAVMYLGRIVELGRASDVLGGPRHPSTQALVDSSAVPDPAVERRRSPRILKGELPEPMSPPSGCPFRTRCWNAAPQCAESLPELVVRSAAPQQVACHFA